MNRTEHLKQKAAEALVAAKWTREQAEELCKQLAEEHGYNPINWSAADRKRVEDLNEKARRYDKEAVACEAMILI